MIVNGTMGPRRLQSENRRYFGTGGVSSCRNRSRGFLPAFRDSATGAVYLSRFADGRPAPFHLLDGLPDPLVVRRGESGGVLEVREGIVSGFVLDERFYTRDEAAACLARLDSEEPKVGG